MLSIDSIVCFSGLKKFTLPDVLGSSKHNDLAVVVLPQPLCPTSPKDSPGLILKLIPSTAFTIFFLLEKKLFDTSKCFTRFLTSIKFLLIDTSGTTLVSIMIFSYFYKFHFNFLIFTAISWRRASW